MKRQAMNWEKTFANHISNNDLSSRVFKEHAKLNSRKANTLI